MSKFMDKAAKNAEKARIDELSTNIIKYNESYHKGDPEISDPEWDKMVKELRNLDPDNKALKRQDYMTSIDKRKRKLPIILPSMVKIETIEEYHKWLKSKEIPLSTTMIISAKYDAISLLVDESKPEKPAYTGGGHTEYGLDMTEHFSHNTGFTKKTNNFYSIGEMIMKNKVFKEKQFRKDDGTLYKNPRNLVSGKATDKDPEVEILKNCDFIRFILVNHNGEEMDKVEQFIILDNKFNQKLKYRVCRAGEITEELLYSLYDKWNNEYEIDGLIIEINDKDLRKSLKPEHDGEPGYARAFKGDFEEVKDTVCTGITYQTSKQGVRSPVVNIEPVDLDGATIDSPYADNGRFLSVYGIGKGTKLSVKRSGKVIPRIVAVEGVHVMDAKEFSKLWKSGIMNCAFENPSYLEDFRNEIGLPENYKGKFEMPPNSTWDKNRVQIIVDGVDDDIVQQQRMVAFFEILGIDGISDGTVEELYGRGYTTINQILELKSDEMSSLDGWGVRKAEIFHNNVHGSGKLEDVPIEKIQHASGFFYGLGSKKLKLVKHFVKKPTISELTDVDGFSDISAEIYLKGLDKFWSWLAELPITIKTESDTQEPISKELEGWAVVFTGFRSKEMEEEIILNGGEIKSGISANSTHLVMKIKGSGTSKEQKALKLGQKILNIEEMRAILNKFK